MIKIAVYGKGGIGKSTTVSNVAAALSEKGLKVMQIGCDPKADSTILLRHGEPVPTVLDLYNQKKQNMKLEEMIKIGYQNVVCVEAGGPTPGLGCAGRGIITALEKLKELGAYELYQPESLLYWRAPLLKRSSSKSLIFSAHMVSFLHFLPEPFWQVSLLLPCPLLIHSFWLLHLLFPLTFSEDSLRKKKPNPKA